MHEWTAGKDDEITPGTVRGVGPWVVANVDGHHVAVGRRCRHLGTDLAKGSIDAAGCLVCSCGATYDLESGRMRRGPQGFLALVPGLGAAFRAVASVVPLPRARVTVRDGELIVTSGAPAVTPA